MLTKFQEKNVNLKYTELTKIGEIISDKVADTVGSWRFISIQSGLIILWIIVNTVGLFNLPKWDPFPFIFLNLTLSFQAAYTAPIIMMSQNRQEYRDRKQAEADYMVNVVAEKEIVHIQKQLKEIQTHMSTKILVKEDLKMIYDELQLLKKSIK